MTATIRRHDVHAPASADFDPEAYDCVGVFDFAPEFDGSETQRRIETVNEMLAQGYRFGGSTTGGCGHCGTLIRYGALMIRPDVKEMIYVGETCLNNRFDGITKAEFQRLRKTASLNREKMAKAAAFELLCDDNQDLAYATYASNIFDAVIDDNGTRFGHVTNTAWALETLGDISRKARQYGDPSPRQLALVSKLMRELTVKAAEFEAYQAAELANRHVQHTAEKAAVLVPTGRITVTGTVVKAVWKDNPYGPGGSVKITIKSAEGWLVWGTAPSNISVDVDRGDTVTLTATVEASDTDPSFGFFKRPVKATRVAAGA